MVKRKIIKKNISLIKDIWEFELIMRDSLINYDEHNSEETIKMFTELISQNPCQKQKLLLIWEASYSFYSCNKTNLSLIKLSCIDDDSFDSLEEEFQEFKLRKKINLAMKVERSEEYRLVEKCIKFEKIKAQDKITCKKLLSCWLHIIENKQSLSFLENEIKSLNINFESLHHLYTTSILKFQDSSMIIDMYCSFIVSFYNDIEKASTIRNKRINTLKFNESNRLALIQENNPIFIVSASHSNMGEILYTNPPLCSLLKDSNLNITGHHISEYFPSKLSLFHNQALKNFKSNVFDSTIYLSMNFIIKDWKNYILEVDILVILLAFYKPFYLVICKPLSASREIALLSKDGVIYVHSEDLRTLLGYENDLKGINIESLIGINIKNLKKIPTSQTICLKNKAITIEYHKEKIHNESIRSLYMYSSEKDYKNSLISQKKSDFEKKVKFIAKNNSKLPSTNLPSLRENNKEDIAKEMQLDEKLPEYQSSSYSSFNPSLHKINLLSDQSRKTLSFLKLILFLSVKAI